MRKMNVSPTFLRLCVVREVNGAVAAADNHNIDDAMTTMDALTCLGIAGWG